MSSTIVSSREFEPGTTGWTSRDLDDPRIEAKWLEGRYEIVEGVLTKMPPAYFAGGFSMQELVFLLKSYLRERQLSDQFAAEVDLIIDEDRIAVADTVWLTQEDIRRQTEAARLAGRSDLNRTRVLVPPTLVIESVSPGHEAHDLRTKKRWYAEFGVPNYWILDGFSRSLQCLVLASGAYRVDASGRDADEVRSSLFPGLIIPLSALWNP